MSYAAVVPKSVFGPASNCFGWNTACHSARRTDHPENARAASRTSASA
jgi:hypothetical protein